MICEDDIEVSKLRACRLLQPPHVNDGLSYFVHFVKLARIKSAIYSKLYSVRSQKGNRCAENLATLNNLDEKLAIRRESLPELPPLEKVLHCPNAVTFLSTVVSHAEYYNCQLMLHRKGLYGALGASDHSIFKTTSTESHCVSSRTKCLTAARHTAQLLSSLREGGDLSRNNLARRLSHFTLSAFFDIFINLLLHPKDPSASSDFHLLQSISDWMSDVLTATTSPLALLLSEILQKWTEVAKDVLARPESDNANQSILIPIAPASNTMGYLVDATGGFPPSTVSSAQQPTDAYYFSNSFTSNVRLSTNPIPTEGLEFFSTASDTLWASGPSLQSVGSLAEEESQSVPLAGGAGIVLVGEKSVQPQYQVKGPD